jgi:hypothetical protein
MTHTETPPSPAEIFHYLIVTFLTPMFLAATGGNPIYAHMAATEAVNAHCPRGLADLLPIAQVIAYGLTILDSLTRSLNPDLSDNLVLRYRGNAASLGRAAEHARRALRPAPLGQTEPQDDYTEADHANEQVVIADLAETKRRLAATAPKPAATPTPAPQPTSQPAPAAASHQRVAQPAATAAQQPAVLPARPVTAAEAEANRRIWADSMTRIAHEFTDNLAHLPPEQRRHASMRASILSGVANNLLTSGPHPPA